MLITDEEKLQAFDLIWKYKVDVSTEICRCGNYKEYLQKAINSNLNDDMILSYVNWNFLKSIFGD